MNTFEMNTLKSPKNKSNVTKKVSPLPFRESMAKSYNKYSERFVKDNTFTGDISQFLYSQIGKHIDQVYSLYRQRIKNYRHIHNPLAVLMSNFKSKERAKKYGGFYISNGILNFSESLLLKKYLQDKKTLKKHHYYNKTHHLINDLNLISNTGNPILGPIYVGNLWVNVAKKYMRLPVFIIANEKWESSSKKIITLKREYTKAPLVSSLYLTNPVVLEKPYMTICKIVDVQNYKRKDISK